MDKLLLSVFVCLFVTAFAVALPLDHNAGFREKRDVVDSAKDAKDTAAKSLSDAGDAIVAAVKPTEKSTVDKIADEIKNVAN